MWDRHKDTPPLLVRVMMYLLNYNPVKLESDEEVITLFNAPLNNNRSTSIKYMEKKSPCLPYNMSQ